VLLTSGGDDSGSTLSAGAATDPSVQNASARGPPAGAVLIHAARGGEVRVDDATVSFAPGALTSDAFVRITPVVVAGTRIAFDLEAWDARTGEALHTFAARPTLTLHVGVFGLAPVIAYVDPVTGVLPVASRYDASAGTVSAELAHFSVYAATFAAPGPWTVNLTANGAPTTLTVSVNTATNELTVSDGSVSETHLIADVTALIINGSADDETLRIDTTVATAGLQVPHHVPRRWRH
jgi:hypothetical protein